MRSTLLATSLIGAALAQDSGNPQAVQYKDGNTGISFIGYADPTGYQFGMAMPENPSSDFIVQLVSPLTNGGGWAGVDFGDSMTGHLLLVAWPNGNKVMIAPRIATGYEVPDTVPYTTHALKLSPIARGTFVNATHVSATFVCGGCIGADSFAAADASATFAFAYSAVAVPSPADLSTQLSTHVSAGEPYGSFDIGLSNARSSQYDTWAALVNDNKGSAGTSPSGSPAAPGSNSGSNQGGRPSSPPSLASSSSSSSSSSGSGGDEDDVVDTYLSSGVIATLALLGILYMLQVVSSLG